MNRFWNAADTEEFLSADSFLQRAFFIVSCVALNVGPARHARRKLNTEREESGVTGACKFLFFGIAEFLETESERVALIHTSLCTSGIVDVRDKIRIAIFVNRIQELRFQ